MSDIRVAVVVGGAGAGHRVPEAVLSQIIQTI